MQVLSRKVCLWNKEQVIISELYFIHAHQHNLNPVFFIKQWSLNIWLLLTLSDHRYISCKLLMLHMPPVRRPNMNSWSLMWLQASVTFTVPHSRYCNMNTKRQRAKGERGKMLDSLSDRPDNTAMPRRCFGQIAPCTLTLTSIKESCPPELTITSARSWEEIKWGQFMRGFDWYSAVSADAFTGYVHTWACALCQDMCVLSGKSRDDRNRKGS